MKKTILIVLILGLGLFAFWGCDADNGTGPDDGNGDYVTELEGTWVGDDSIYPDNNVTFIFTDYDWDFTVSGKPEWYKGTFTLDTSSNPKQIDFIVNECNETQYVGKVSLGIYQIENNTMTLSALEPGTTTRPTSFSNDGARVWILNKQ